MDARAISHPTDESLRSYGLGKLDGAAIEVLRDHLMRCPGCRRRIGELTAESVVDGVRNARGKGTYLPGPSATESISARGANTPATPPASTLPPGLANHPDYEILRELGRGGMGVVYLAQNRLMGRKEVLKVVSGHLLDRPGVADRFLREIRSAARLHHANIVTAYSALRASESLVFAMEYVEGYDLAQLVKSQGPLPVAHACKFVYEAALGLQHAHEKGMVHRDIKPNNLILAREGRKPVVKVLDFGLAKATREGHEDTSLTEEGQLLGTPDFMAPEQSLDAQKADIRADIYSLGCTLYYLLKGAPPFRAKSLYELLKAHQSMNPTPLNLARPAVPLELAALVARMMAKEPERRFQTPKAVAQALKPFFKTAIERPEASPEQPPAPAATRSPSTIELADGLAETEPEEVEPEDTPAPEPASRPRWFWPSLAAGFFFVALLTSWAALFRTGAGNGSNASAGPETGSSVFPGAPAGPADTAREGDRTRPPARQEWTNPMGMRFVRIEAGEFRMGSSPYQVNQLMNLYPPTKTLDWWNGEQPQHFVRITRPFLLGVCEVTQGQYKTVTGKNPSHFTGSEALPVEQVSWIDAATFCNRLSEQSGRKPYYRIAGDEAAVAGGTGYRLPAEAEWEYACRAGTSTLFPFGDDPRVAGDHTWYIDNSGKVTQPVGQKRANPWGLHDMMGNVWEWCDDWYDVAYYQSSPGTDPPGARRATKRVSRGGAWECFAGFCRPAFRGGWVPGTRDKVLGFRVAAFQE